MDIVGTVEPDRFDGSGTLRVLIVEDEYFIAGDLVPALEAHGMTVCGPVANAQAALARLRSETVDCAILDIKLEGAICFDVAADLRSRGIPFLFLTGYGKDMLPPEFDDVPVLQKPCDTRRIVAALRRLQAGE